MEKPACVYEADLSFLTCCMVLETWTMYQSLTAAWLAQLGERRSTEREVAGSNPGRTNTQGL